MSLTHDQLTSVANKTIDAIMVDGVFKSNALWARLTRKGSKKIRSGGTQLSFAITHFDDTETTGSWYSGTQTFDGSEYDPITSSVFDWKNVQETITIARDKIRKASGDTAKIAFLAERINFGKKALRHRLGKGLHNDGVTDSEALIGLDLIMDATTASYGDLSTTDFAEWTPVKDVNGGTNRALTLARWQSMQGSLTEDDDKPTCVVGRQGIYNSFWGLLQPHQRLIYDKTMSNLGHEGVLNFNGIPFLIDSKAKANSITFLNEEYFFLVCHKDAIMERETFKTLENSDAFRSRVINMLALCCNNRRFQGRIEDIIES